PALTKNKNGLTPGTSYRASSRTWCDPAGGRYKASSWTPFIFWTQPTTVRLGGENTAITNLDVYPNPSRDIFNVSFETLKEQDLEIKILNVIGEVVFTESKQQFVGVYIKQINLVKYPKAIYFLEIETNDGVVNKKLVLQ
ncbi:MAG: T9SS type A sorting domain-containing protein, partial [Flavobacteriales bacterium]|nr:T9SS type A sorting domain-containing protein [Flavobacteriales bacterium]